MQNIMSRRKASFSLYHITLCHLYCENFRMLNFPGHFSIDFLLNPVLLGVFSCFPDIYRSELLNSQKLACSMSSTSISKRNYIYAMKRELLVAPGDDGGKNNTNSTGLFLNAIQARGGKSPT